MIPVRPHACDRVPLPLGLYLSAGHVWVLDSSHCGDGEDSGVSIFRLHLFPGFKPLSAFCGGAWTQNGCGTVHWKLYREDECVRLSLLTAWFSCDPGVLWSFFLHLSFHSHRSCFSINRTGVVQLWLPNSLERFAASIFFFWGVTFSRATPRVYIGLCSVASLLGTASYSLNSQ